jgi:hypothetical protein
LFCVFFIYYLRHDVNDDGLELKGWLVGWRKEPQVFFCCRFLYIYHGYVKRRKITHVVHTMKKRRQRKERRKKQEEEYYYSEWESLDKNKHIWLLAIIFFVAMLSVFLTISSLRLIAYSFICSILHRDENKIIIRQITSMVKTITEKKPCLDFPLFPTYLIIYNQNSRLVPTITTTAFEKTHSKYVVFFPVTNWDEQIAQSLEEKKRQSNDSRAHYLNMNLAIYFNSVWMNISCFIIIHIRPCSLY